MNKTLIIGRGWRKNMANTVRMICTKIGNGHQYLLGTAKTSAYGSHLMSDTIQQRPDRIQVIYFGSTTIVNRLSQGVLQYVCLSFTGQTKLYGQFV